MHRIVASPKLLILTSNRAFGRWCADNLARPQPTLATAPTGTKVKTTKEEKV